MRLLTSKQGVFGGFSSNYERNQSLYTVCAFCHPALGVTVNAIAPGPTQTGWMNDELIESVLPQIPMARIGTAEDIADTVLFLASDKASWVSGQIIKVSGGHGL